MQLSGFSKTLMSASLIAQLTLVQVASMAGPTPTPTTSPQPAELSPIPSPTHIPGSVTLLVPGGTSVSVSLTEQVSSGSATANETVPIIVTKEVDVNSMVVIPKGANGQATISSVDKAGGNGHGGQLAFTMDWVYSADGGKLQLSNVNHNSENGDQKGASSTASIVTYLLLGPLGLFAHNFVRGKDVVVDSTKVFDVFVDHDVHIDATQKAAPPPGFDQ